MRTVPNPSVRQRYLDTRQAFDSVASEYDGPSGNNRLIQHMRTALWQVVGKIAAPEMRLLDLGCGAGLDAVHFAQGGHCVTAIDWSSGMVAKTRERAKQARVMERLTVVQLGIHELGQLAGERFDIIYSNLGALNCLPDPWAVAQNCAALQQSGGLLVFSIIGRTCPWELAYYGLRGDWQRARIRWSSGQVPVSLNGYTVWTRYYSPKEFYRSFAQHYEWRTCQALHVFLPPPYMLAVYERHPFFFKLLAWLDQHAGSLPLINLAGDHFLLVMERRG